MFGKQRKAQHFEESINSLVVVVGAIRTLIVMNAKEVRHLRQAQHAPQAQHSVCPLC